MPPESPIIEPDQWTRSLDLEALFPRPAPLEVDVGCGKGRFLAARASRFPDRNFLGIDRLRSRLARLLRKIERLDLTNVRLLRLEAAYSVAYLLPAGSVAAFHIFFPDPWPKRRHHRRRLFTAPFLADLHRALAPAGRINVATDHEEYFGEIRHILLADRRYREIEAFVPAPEERTDFEVLFTGKGLPVSRCSFVKSTAKEERSAVTPGNGRRETLRTGRDRFPPGSAAALPLAGGPSSRLHGRD
jgi:tRNA (guanine-N7-)-methyltransferase